MVCSLPRSHPSRSQFSSRRDAGKCFVVRTVLLRAKDGLTTNEGLLATSGGGALRVMKGSLWRVGEGVEGGDAEVLEVAGVAGDDGEAVDGGDGGDEGVMHEGV